MRKQTDHVRLMKTFIIRSIPAHPRDIVSVVSKQFGISRQAVSRHVQELVREGRVTAEGNTRQRRYKLSILKSERFNLPLAGLQEDQVWRTRLLPALKSLPKNVVDIWHYAFTEMVNNAIDHSGGQELMVTVEMDALRTEIWVRDDGMGIFKKITKECHLEDESHAVLELAKGKLTTDPHNHTGEGIFFTSRMLDDFGILSGGVHFWSRSHGTEDWVLEREQPRNGTSVFMFLDNDSTRTDQEVFDRFASEDEDYGFTKTIVPVRLARQGAEKLVSRSQAKRLLTRIDRFNTVIFDFEDVDSIGQGFADEIFRVFSRDHPNIAIFAINKAPQVDKMIAHVEKNGIETREAT